MDLYQLDKALFDHKVILLCGSGGVGKTTIAASIALQAAREGKKVLAVTIDPARRLASALGGIHIGSSETPVDLQSAGFAYSGELFALMLDTKTASDELVTKFAPNNQTLRAILDNRIYRTMSESLAGSEEFIALGKLHDLLISNVYDLIVVDTAPTRYALDFFEAPTRLVDLLNNTIIDTILSPVRRIHQSGFDFIRKSSNMIAEVLDKLLGVNLIHEVSGFIMSIENMLAGFRERSFQMHEMIKDPKITALGIVTSASQSSMHEALTLLNTLQKLTMPVNFIVINRIHPDFFGTPELHQALHKFLNDAYVQGLMTQALSKMECPDPNLVVDVLNSGLYDSNRISQIHEEHLEGFHHQTNSNVHIAHVPFLESDVSDLAGLAQVAQLLFRN